jgi:hypothetical protein
MIAAIMVVAVFVVVPVASAYEDLTEDLTGIDILYDLNHGERDTGELSILLDDAKSRGATVSYNNLTITSELLDDYEILLINEQGTVFWSTSELAAIRRWVANGGGVFFNGDEINEGMAVAGMFGISYSGNPGSSGLTTNIVPHYITAGVSSMTVPNPVQTLITTYLAFPIVYDTDSNAMVAVSYYGSGKIVIFANDMLRDEHINESDNRILGNRALIILRVIQERHQHSHPSGSSHLSACYRQSQQLQSYERGAKPLSLLLVLPFDAPLQALNIFMARLLHCGRPPRRLCNIAGGLTKMKNKGRRRAKKLALLPQSCNRANSDYAE